MEDAVKNIRNLVYEKDYELFRKIIEMVHSINVKICIEGIEKEAWNLRMKEMHVDYLQGYLFGNPCARVKTGGILCYGTWVSGFTH